MILQEKVSIQCFRIDFIYYIEFHILSLPSLKCCGIIPFSVIRCENYIEILYIDFFEPNNMFLQFL